MLSVDGGFAPRAEPAEDCTACALLAQWSHHYIAEGDGSRATDYVVEIRNHPHSPPKLTLPEHAPPQHRAEPKP
ncbi:hypothetical protein [Streptomyces showdoensis]|uniref:Uncharacterized protein n=1 Tax=Streptomyces showdoensis TaxID=68268 RepID=A0A2P2GR28_STREW|nr:hypothetical protein [Streptomyces showdoensis]KKZ73946.1 hypothetical protein VO63_10075 [Streptomyces showdoensis]